MEDVILRCTSGGIINVIDRAFDYSIDRKKLSLYLEMTDYFYSSSKNGVLFEKCQIETSYKVTKKLGDEPIVLDSMKLNELLERIMSKQEKIEKLKLSCESGSVNKFKKSGIEVALDKIGLNGVLKRFPCKVEIKPISAKDIEDFFATKSYRDYPPKQEIMTLEDFLLAAQEKK